MKISNLIFSLLALGIIIFSINQVAHAEVLSCLPGQYQFHDGNLNLMVPKGEHLVFLFHNTSDKPVILNPLLKSPGASAGYSTEIQAGLFSALDLGKDLTMNCATHYGERIRYVPCEQVLKICHYPALQFPTKHHGDIWIAENKIENLAMNAVLQHQISK